MVNYRREFEPIGKFSALGFGHVQAELAPAPEDVLRRAGPLVADQVVGFTLGKAGAEVAAEIAGLAGLPEDVVRDSAVASNQAGDGAGGQEGVGGLEVGSQGGLAVPGEVAAWQRG